MENKEHTKYIITQEQLEIIEHYRRMFQLSSDNLKDLCSIEKDDIVYGFELGQMHRHFGECSMNLMELENEIRSQKVIDNKKIKTNDK